MIKKLNIPVLENHGSLLPNFENIKINNEAIISMSLINDDHYELVYDSSLLTFPIEVTRRQFLIELAFMGIDYDEVEEKTKLLPEPNKTIALWSLRGAGTFERYDENLIWVAKNLMNLSDEQIDNLFINANTR